MTQPATILCGLLIVGGAVAHGMTTRRWAATDGPPPQSAKLHAWTLSLGDYACEEIPNDLPVKEKSTATSKRYTSATKPAGCVVTVITGPPGAVATHCPDVCYPASGYRTTRETTRQTVELPGGGTASYYMAEFEKTTQTRADRQRVRWGWSVGGGWEAPDRPRFAYLTAAELAKIYVITAAEPVESASPADDPPAIKSLVAGVLAQSSAALTGN